MVDVGHVLGEDEYVELKRAPFLDVLPINRPAGHI